MSETGLIFNIQKFCVHDGPGIRSIVFFKGCPLRCQWCANPEGMHTYPEIALKARKCIGMDKCGRCFTVCPQGAIIHADNIVKINRELCTNCGQCAEACPAKAIEVLGKYMTVEAIIQEVLKDDAFYARSEGGITFSGGEPLLQAEFLTNLIKAARVEGLTTAIETTGCVPWEKAMMVFNELDFIHYDIKHMNDEKHRRYTGVSNLLCLENFKQLCQQYPDKKILVRTPVIPGVNDTVDEIQAIADFINKTAAGMADIAYELLPYHNFGSSKYEFLGRSYALNGVQNMGKTSIEMLKQEIHSEINLL